MGHGKAQGTKIAISAALMMVLALQSPVAWGEDAPAQKCLAGPVVLAIDHQFEDRRSGGGIGRAQGSAEARAPLAIDGNRVSGSAFVAMRTRVRGIRRGVTCTANGTIHIKWSFEGSISDQCIMDLTVARESTERAYTMVCSSREGTLGPISVPAMPTQVGQAPLQLKAEIGASAAQEIKRDDYKQSTIYTLTAGP